MIETPHKITVEEKLQNITDLRSNSRLYAETLALNQAQTTEWSTVIEQLLTPVTQSGASIEAEPNSNEYIEAEMQQLKQRIALRIKRHEIIARIHHLQEQNVSLNEKQAIVSEVLLFLKQRQAFEKRNTTIEFVHLPLYINTAEEEPVQEATEQVEPEQIEQESEVTIAPLPPELLEQSPRIAEAFGLPAEALEGWQQFVGILDQEIPLPEEAIALQTITDPQERAAKLKHIRDHLQTLLERRKKIIDILPKYIEIAKNNPESLTAFYRSALIAEIINYASNYKKYITEHHRPNNNTTWIDDITTMFFMEISEEYLEDLAPMPSSRGGIGLTEALKTKNFLNLDIVKTSMDLEKRFARQMTGIGGPKNIPKIDRILRGSNNIFRELLNGATPESAVTFLIYAYYIHTAEDKMKASLKFANFMVMSGMSNAAMGIAERMIQNRALAAWGRNSMVAARRWRMASKAPGYLKIVAAIGLTVGLDHMIGFDEKFEALSRNFNAADWEAGGIVAGVMAGETLIGQASEIGYLTGLNRVNPETEQEDFLSQRVLTSQQMNSQGQYTGEYHLWLNHVHTLEDWDDQVDYAIETEQDPAVQALWRTQYISKGPGGTNGWIERQALKYYNEWGALREQEKTMNELAAELGIINYNTTPEGQQIAQQQYSLYLLLKSGAADDVYGAQGIANTPQYNNLRSALQRLKNERPDDQRIKTLEKLMNNSIKRAEYLAKIRGTYIHLGIFSSNWTEERPVPGTDNVLLPEIAERGMISQIILNSQRITKLAPNLQVEDITTKMPEFSLMSIPAILNHIIDYIGREREVVFSYQRKLDLQHFARMMESAVPEEKRYDVYSALQSAISGQSNENLIDPDDVANALAMAYIDNVVDGHLHVGSGRSAHILHFGDTSNLLEISRYNRGLPVVRTGHDFHGTRIDCLMEIRRNEDNQSWEVYTKTSTTVPHRNGYGRFNGKEVCQTYDEWAKKHPQFAERVSIMILEWEERMERLHQEADERQRQQREEREAEKPENLRLVEEQNAKRQVALEQAKQTTYPMYIPPRWEFNEETLRITGQHQNHDEFTANYEGYDFTILVPSINQGAQISAGHGDWKKEVLDHEHFRSILTNENGGRTEWKTSVWGLKHNDVYDAESRRVITHILTTPLDVSGHPRGNDADFVEHVREYEIQRLLDATSFHWSGSWSGEQVQAYFYRGLIDYYKDMSGGRGAFLTDLLEFLQTSDPITYSQCRSFLRKLGR